jgi:hypothetical protein
MFWELLRQQHSAKALAAKGKYKKPTTLQVVDFIQGKTWHTGKGTQQTKTHNG